MRAFFRSVFAVLLCGCGDSTTPTVIHDIVTSGQTFLPTLEIVNRGEEVRWTFSVAADSLGHNVLFKPRVAGAPEDILKEQRSGQISRVFTTAGDFTYVCDLHGGMNGTITVK